MSEIEDKFHKTTLRVPLGLFRRIHQLWQAGQDAGRIPWKTSRAMYMIQLMERGLVEEEALVTQSTSRRGRRA